MIIVIIALIVFGIGTAALVKWTIEKPTPVKIVFSVLCVVTWVATVGWALKEFS